MRCVVDGLAFHYVHPYPSHSSIGRREGSRILSSIMGCENVAILYAFLHKLGHTIARVTILHINQCEKHVEVIKMLFLFGRTWC